MSEGAGSEQFRRLACGGRVGEYIAWAEAGLRAIARTPFHAVLGQSFDNSLDASVDHLIATFRAATSAFTVGALYFEMNGFDINPGSWWFSGFAYEKAGDLYEPEWLADWGYQSDNQVELLGMRKLQEAYRKHCERKAGETVPLKVNLAAAIASHLVCARYMEHIGRAHKAAKRRARGMQGIPVVATAHDWDDFVVFR